MPPLTSALCCSMRTCNFPAIKYRSVPLAIPVGSPAFDKGVLYHTIDSRDMWSLQNTNPRILSKPNGGWFSITLPGQSPSIQSGPTGLWLVPQVDMIAILIVIYICLVWAVRYESELIYANDRSKVLRLSPFVVGNRARARALSRGRNTGWIPLITCSFETTPAVRAVFRLLELWRPYLSFLELRHAVPPILVGYIFWDSHSTPRNVNHEKYDLLQCAVSANPPVVSIQRELYQAT